MKSKVSLTLDEDLLRFAEKTMPGENRSAKVEEALRRLKRIAEEGAIRNELSNYYAGLSAKERGQEEQEFAFWRDLGSNVLSDVEP
ncbi:MAG TPA: hypothetical protein VJM76_04060 [Gammaproteobacteria bacterium]|nr:hypothetical protein [Gammaproteobacteria bacterium]